MFRTTEEGRVLCSELRGVIPLSKVVVSVNMVNTILIRGLLSDNIYVERET